MVLTVTAATAEYVEAPGAEARLDTNAATDVTPKRAGQDKVSVLERVTADAETEGVPVYNLRAGSRALTRMTMADEAPGLLQERDQLLDKKYNGGLEAREERRLTYVRWQLYRIDDAIAGDQLDEMSALVNQQERFAEMVDRYMRLAKKLAAESRLQPTIAPPHEQRRRARG